MNEATVSRSAAPSSFQEAVRPGIAAVRRLWLPFVIIQACGLLVVVAYFRSESVRGICGHLARWKHAGGFAFSAAAMAISGAIVPEIALYLTGQNRRFDRRRGRDVVFHLVLFAVSGMSVDAFYRLLAVMIGDSATPGTIAAKVAIDQLIYTPLLGVTIIASAYSLRRQRFRAMRWSRKLGRRWYVKEVLPLIPPCWAYWTPMCVLMYTLPVELTFVFGAIASAASATLLVAVARDA